MITNANSERYAKYKWLIMLAIALMSFMVMLDATIVNIALPVMAKDIAGGLESAQLVVVFYLITVVATLLLLGRLGDVKGKGRLFIFGVILFTVGSFIAGISSNLGLLLTARIIQGIGGASALANNQGIITEVFPSNERGKSLGILGISIALGTMLGPVIGGLLVSHFHWGYIFFINIPIGIAALILSLKVLPLGEKTKQKVDFRGALLLAILVIVFFCTLLMGRALGYGHPYIILGFAISVALFILFYFIERKKAQAIIDLSIFSNPTFRVNIICVIIQFFVVSGVSIVSPFYMEDVLKISPGQTGLIIMAFPIAMGIMSPISGSISDKIGTERVTLFGLVIMAIGFFLLSTLTIQEPAIKIVIYLLIIGIGAGTFATPNTSTIMSLAPKGKLGMTGSINAFMRNVGTVLGISILTTILYAVMSSRIGREVDGYVYGKPDVFIMGMQTVYIVSGVLLCIGALLIALRIFKNNRQKKSIA